MKKIILTSILLLTTLHIFCQENWDKSECEKCIENPFTFDRTVIIALEKYAKFSGDYDVNTDDKRKSYIGALMLDNESDSILSGKYLTLSSIPSSEKFIMISSVRIRKESEVDLAHGIEEKDYGKILIQNLNSKKYYIINTKTFNYIDYKQLSQNGFKSLVKNCPKTLSPKESELINRYKTLIKSANTNISVLNAIQLKSRTRGYFDSTKVNSSDKKIYNQNLANLKIKAEKLAEIDRYEDKDNKAQDKLTISELSSLSNINDWNMNQFKIN